MERVLTPEQIDRMVDRVASREIDIYSAADAILRDMAMHESHHDETAPAPIADGGRS
jgi:hypothetical protein